MNTGESIAAVVVFLLAAICAMISILHFAEKGPLLNNAYIYAFKEDRAKMDKSPHYRQSAVVFALLSAIFVVIGSAIIFDNSKIMLIEIPLVVVVLIYAVISSIKIEKNKN